ncbi:hypothetical protein, partial [Pseudomonas putida]|uniref:hypothetical protein n=1 Tax=Pseudomonas putida TaxID=303 RepID=UPI001C435E04
GGIEHGTAPEVGTDIGKRIGPPGAVGNRYLRVLGFIGQLGRVEQMERFCRGRLVDMAHTAWNVN